MRIFNAPAATLEAERICAAGGGDCQSAYVESRADPDNRLLKRQQLILKRMGAVTPPEQSSSTLNTSNELAVPISLTAF